MNFSQNEIRESEQAKLMDSSTTPEILSDLLQSYMLPLDGYRGLAILLVFISHCEPINGADHTILIDDFYKTVLSYGSFGVDAFFVLSGFLITNILLDKQDRTNFFINFYLRRSLRILPPYYLFLIVFFLILTPVLGKYEFYQHLHSAQIWYWLYLDNFWLIRFWPGSHELNIISHLWSLAVEVHFYLFWPFLIYFLPRRLLSWAFSTVIFCAAGIRLWLIMTDPIILSSDHNIYYSTFCRMDTLAVGGLIALWMRSDCALSRLLRLSKLALILSGISIALIIVIKEYTLRGTLVFDLFVYSLLSIFFGALLVLSLTQSTDSFLVKALTWFPLKRLGTVSYGLYIYHFPLAHAVRQLLQQYSFPSYILAYLSNVFLTGVLTLPICLFSWYFFEQPILRLKSYLNFDVSIHNNS